jgi:pyruvate formate lyase activating enzyme
MMEGILFNIQKFSIHDGPGIRTAVFFKGCPLRCGWCSNPESHLMGLRIFPESRRGEFPDQSLSGRSYSAEEVLAICLEDLAFYEESGGGVTLTGGEVLAQDAFAEALLVRLGEAGVHRAVETSGYAVPAVFNRVADHTDLILFDIKHHDRDRHFEGTGVYPEMILDNFRSALGRRASGEGPRVLPRIPVIPGYNDGLEDAAAFAELLRDAGEVQLLPFHQFGQNKYARLGLRYGFDKAKALRPEGLEPYRRVFESRGLRAFF